MNVYPYNDYRNYLMHYAKGEEADNHKYLYKKNGRYIYEEDVARSGGSSLRPQGRRRNISGSSNVFKQNKGIAGHRNALSSNTVYDRFKNKSSSQKMINSIRTVLSKGLNEILAESSKKAKKKVKAKAEAVKSRLKKLRKTFDSVLKRSIW